MKLTLSAMCLGQGLGVWRHSNAVLLGRINRMVANDAWGIDRLGGLGETVFALWYYRDDPVGFRQWYLEALLKALTGDFKSDVGPYQVRAIEYDGATPMLSVQRDDSDLAVYVLVMLNDLPTATIAGWAWGYDVKQPANWNTEQMRRRNCYTMLSADLHPMDELPTPEEIYERVHQAV